MVGTLRNMLKYYNWTIRSITTYKLWRLLQIITIISFQNFTPLATGSLIAFFGSMVALQSGMLHLVSLKSDDVRKEAREKNITQSVFPTFIYKRIASNR